MDEVQWGCASFPKGKALQRVWFTLQVLNPANWPLQTFKLCSSPPGLNREVQKH